MDGKKCFKCGRIKPLHLFYRHPKMGDGFLGKCQSCTKKDVRAQRLKRIDYYRQYDRDRAKLRGALGLKRHRKKNPGKTRARSATSNAVRDGTLTKGPCEVCGEKKVHAHHDDYRKPLSVRWLCFKHHWQVHGVTI